MHLQHAIRITRQGKQVANIARHQGAGANKLGGIVVGRDWNLAKEQNVAILAFRQVHPKEIDKGLFRFNFHSRFLGTRIFACRLGNECFQIDLTGTRHVAAAAARRRHG